MTDTLTYPDVVQWAVPGFIALVLAEMFWIHWTGRGGRYETRDALTSLIMGAGNVASGIALGFITYVVLKAGTGRHKEISVSLWALCAIFIAKFVFL